MLSGVETLPSSSEALRFRLTVPPAVGVPERVRVAGLKDNHDGSAVPVAVVAERVRVESGSVKRSERKV